MQKPTCRNIILSISPCFLLLLCCCRPEERAVPQAKTNPDSLVVSGIFTGNLYRHVQVNMANPPINTTDTVTGAVFQLTLLDSTHLRIDPVGGPFSLGPDTIERRPLSESSPAVQGASMYFYGYKKDRTHAPWNELVYYVYSFAGNDSVYINIFPPPGGGQSTNWYFYGSK